MNREEFIRMMEIEFAKILLINKTKGKDYAGDVDAFSNFKRTAAAVGLKPEQVWAVYASKHWDAVMTYCREGQVESEPIEGRIHDVILYCFLLLGQVKAKQGRIISFTKYEQLNNVKEEDECQPKKAKKTK